MVYLHAHGVLHCDVKSSNVLLTRSFEVKLCDFGLSQLLGSGRELSINVGCIGTPQWVAPEVLRGGGYSKAADVYSFGMILLELVSRQVPFDGYSAPQVIAMVGYGGFRLKLPSSCPRPLLLLLRKTLRGRPESRCVFQELTDDFAVLHKSFVLDV